MHRLIQLLVAMTLWNAGTSPAFGVAAQNPALTLEVAPLKATLGQWAMRSEFRVAPTLAVGGGYDTTVRDGERPDMQDWQRTYHLEALWYPFRSEESAWFVSAGFAMTDAVIGRRTERDTMTWVRPDSDEIYDTWTNEDRYLSVRESIGYRVIGMSYMTASLRFTLDQLMHTASRTTDQAILSLDRDTTTPGRQKVEKHFLLHAGFSFP